MHSFERCVVLVADDEPGIVQIVSFALRRHGYEVITASDGLSALRAGQERAGPIHLALLDVMMPGMTGPAVFARLQEIHPESTALFMSGYSPRQLEGLPLDTRKVQFIPKPFLPRALVQRVNEILGNDDVCALLDDEQVAMA